MELKRQIEEKALTLADLRCHRCKERHRLEKALKRERRFTEAIRNQTRTLEHLRNSYWEQFLRVLEVLRRFGYLRDRTLTPEGLLIGDLRHDNELLVARVVFSGALDGFKSYEMMAILFSNGGSGRSRRWLVRSWRSSKPIGSSSRSPCTLPTSQRPTSGRQARKIGCTWWRSITADMKVT
jgi:superfamily II RNA helicase